MYAAAQLSYKLFFAFDEELSLSASDVSNTNTNTNTNPTNKH